MSLQPYIEGFREVSLRELYAVKDGTDNIERSTKAPGPASEILQVLLIHVET